MTADATLQRANAMLKAEGGFWTECLARALTPTDCTFLVGDVTQHACDRPMVALLVDPQGAEEPRCLRHSRACETALEKDRGRYPGCSLRWVVERDVAA